VHRDGAHGFAEVEIELRQMLDNSCLARLRVTRDQRGDHRNANARFPFVPLPSQLMLGRMPVDVRSKMKRVIDSNSNSNSNAAIANV